MTLFFLVAAAFMAAPFVFLTAQRSNPALTAFVPAVLFCAFLIQLPQVLTEHSLIEQTRWIPSLGITLSFQLDAFALLFALLITGIGTLIFLYASAYLNKGWRTPRFFATLTIFMASMLGAVLSDDLLGLIVFWELTSLSSFMLIGYDSTQAQSRRSAQQGLLVTVGGGLAMLAGAILLGSVAGTYRISEIIALDLGAQLSGPLGTTIVVLIAIGAFSKSAQAPLHSWLANAMVAPTPVSAYLHSATMVKLGVYLLARLNPVLSESTLWTPLLLSFGSLTMLTGVILAIRHTDLKRILAYSTIVSLGTLISLIGLDHPFAAIAMVTFLLIHALYKASLFMVAGIVDHATGTRDSARLCGLAAFMPITAAAVNLAALSMAGLPFFLGFIGKELIYEASLSANAPYLVIAIAVLSNACMVAIAGVIGFRCFFRKPTEANTLAQPSPKDPPWAMWAGPAILAAFGVIFGLMPGLLQQFLVQAATAVHGDGVQYTLSLWHGFTPMLALSILTLAGGLGIYHFWDRIQHSLNRLAFLDKWGPDVLYDKTLNGLMQFANWQTGRIQTGSLRHYMAFSVGLVAVVVLVTMVVFRGMAIPNFSFEGVGMEAFLPFLLIGAAIMVLRSRSIVQGIISAGAVGFGVAVVFLLYGAPDLAFTQFSVEALAVVILLAIIGHMPFRVSDPRTVRQRNRDAIVAALFGLMFIVVMFSVIALPFDDTLSEFFREASLPLAHGRNLVNVIIVDFRALDTLGEITVLALAAIAAMTVFYSAGKDDTVPHEADTVNTSQQP